MDDKSKMITPPFEILTQKLYTAKEWLSYYANIWNRNVIATLLDVWTDTETLKVNPKALTGKLVQTPEGPAEQTTADRLEDRKESVRQAQAIVKAVEYFSTLSEEDYAKILADDSTFLAPIAPTAPEAPAAPAAAVDPSLVSYIVQPGQTFTLVDGSVKNAGDLIALNPEDEATKNAVAGGFIAVTTAV